MTHFSLFGLATAGRDQDGYRFERQSVAEQLSVAVNGLTAAGLPGIHLALTLLSEAGRRIAAAVMDGLSSLAVEIVEDLQRQAGRGDYRDLCFKVNARINGALDELGEGGFTDWTQKLTRSKKERLLISGLGIDRLASLINQP